MNRNRKIFLMVAAVWLVVSLACVSTGSGRSQKNPRIPVACDGNPFIRVDEENLGGAAGVDYDKCEYRYTFTNTHATDTISLYLLSYEDNTLGGDPVTSWNIIDTLEPGASTIYTCSIYHFAEEAGDDADDYVPPYTTREILKAYAAVRINSGCTDRINDKYLEDAAALLTQNYCR